LLLLKRFETWSQGHYRGGYKDTPCYTVSHYSSLSCYKSCLDLTEVTGMLHSWPYIKCRTLDKTISKLEMELAAARAAQDSIVNGSPIT